MVLFEKGFKIISMTSKQRFFSVLNNETPDRTPVFPLVMGFAAKRHGVSYKEFALNGEVMAQAQLQLFDDFEVDAITACSDAFRISADLGGDIVFPEDSPPHLTKALVACQDDLKKLNPNKILTPGSRTADRINGVREMVKAIGDRCAVLGWVDMPFAEACSACGVAEFMTLLYDEPVLMHELLEFLTKSVIDFAFAQLDAGAPMIGAGDAAASLISPELYREFALPYEQQVCDAIHNKGGLIKLHICGNTSKILPDISELNADLFNVDHLVDFNYAVEIYGKKGKAFKGNLDPVADLFQSTPEIVIEKAKNLISIANEYKYILSPGCEIPPDTNEDVFKAFCDAVK